MRKIAIWLIEKYQRYLSRDTGVFRSSTPVCAFYPTCSEYAKQAFSKYGFFKAFLLSVKRISKCHPWQKNHFDPLP